MPGFIYTLTMEGIFSKVEMDPVRVLNLNSYVGFIIIMRYYDYYCIACPQKRQNDFHYEGDA